MRGGGSDEEKIRGERRRKRDGEWERKKETKMTEREEYLYCVFLSRFTLSHTQVRRGSLLSFGRCVCLCMCRRWRTCLVCVRVCLLYGYGRMYW